MGPTLKIMSFSIFQQHVFNSGEHMKTFLLAAWNVADEFLFLGIALPHNTVNQFESAGIFPTPRVRKPLALYPGHSPTIFNSSFDALMLTRPSRSGLGKRLILSAALAYMPIAWHKADEHFVFDNLLNNPVTNSTHPP